MELSEYQQSIETFRDLVQFYPESEEGQKELLRAETTLKKY